MADIFDLDGIVKEALIATSGITVGPWHLDYTYGTPIGINGIAQVQLGSVDYSGLSEQLVNFAFATATPVPTSETPVQIDTYVYANNSDLQQSQTVGSTKTTVASLQVTITQGVQTTLGDSFNVGFAGYGGASVSFSMQTNLSTADQQAQSVTQIWNCTTPILVPARKGIKLTWSVLTAEYQIPFSGSVRIAGSIGATFLLLMVGEFGLLPSQSGGNILPNPWPDKQTVAIGTLFLQYPNPRVTVIDANTIEIAVSGLSSSTNGIDLQTDVEQYDLPGQNAEPAKQNVEHVELAEQNDGEPPKKNLVKKTLYRFRPVIGVPSRKG
jgi:Clostridium epsilon toxin ETX/Bacillus mosquitocidal toxin MTX2